MKWLCVVSKKVSYHIEVHFPLDSDSSYTEYTVILDALHKHTCASACKTDMLCQYQFSDFNIVL